MKREQAETLIGALIRTPDGGEFQPVSVEERYGKPALIAEDGTFVVADEATVIMTRDGRGGAKCPNCQQPTLPMKPGHENGCVVGALLRVLEDRGHDLSGCDITEIGIDTLWERYLDKAVDSIADTFDMPPYPDESEDAAHG